MLCFILYTFVTGNIYLAGVTDEGNFKEEADDMAKVAYLKQAAAPGSEKLFKANKLIPRDLEDTLDWLYGKTNEEIMRLREGTIQVIEDLGTTLREQGKTQKWLQSIKDDKVRKISENINGPLLEVLTTKIKLS